MYEDADKTQGGETRPTWFGRALADEVELRFEAFMDLEACITAADKRD